MKDLIKIDDGDVKMKICPKNDLECVMENIHNGIPCDVGKDKIKEHLKKSIRKNKIMVGGDLKCMYELLVG